MSDPVQTMLNELSAALADVVETLSRSGAEQGAAMADLVSAIEKRKSADFSDVVAAIKALRDVKPPPAPQVTVNVQPTPVDVKVAAPTVNVQAPNVTVQTSKPVSWEMDVSEVNGEGRIQRIRLTPIYK